MIVFNLRLAPSQGYSPEGLSSNSLAVYGCSGAGYRVGRSGFSSGSVIHAFSCYSAACFGRGRFGWDDPFMSDNSLGDFMRGSGISFFERGWRDGLAAPYSMVSAVALGGM